MYVCVCKAITEEQIRQAVAEGVDSLAQLRDRFGLGVDCGKCCEYARRCLGAAKSDDGPDPFV